jgi:DNA-directed RNA polymerase specialized sigma24 family protein
VSENDARSLIARGMAELVHGGRRGIREKARTPAPRGVPDVRWMLGIHELSPFEIVARRERREIISTLLDAMAARDVLLVQLRYSGELTFGQIGVAMGICEDAASRLHGRVLDRMRERLAGARITSVNSI